MKIYLIDCDSYSRRELTRMIEGEELGEVAGVSAGWDDACRRIPGIRPDVILADLPLPELKAVTCIRRIKETLPAASIIMLSQAHDMETVQRAYEGGAELLLHKPVNMAEIRNTLRSMEMVKNMQWILKQARSGVMGTPDPGGEDGRPGEADGGISLSLSVRHLKGILQEIGILNEAGSKDIIRIISYMIEQELEFGDITIRELCRRMKQNSKSVEQRIRRAASDGMYNLAARGLDDYADPVFNEYAGRLYSFEQMKKEMNYIRGKSEKHGNIRIRNFLGGLLDCCREM
ncbi:response regulator [Clostridiales bacterium TF09-2AC]|uniref:Stage 0 sporulation protein A homolog n=1 Tax=Enterocloster hominis (ex Hitch et al. 2024) TaxID=1917870 RepID=A0ABV1D999_9FIRM|nr:response regulator [Clostridiales bacterium TF09-2AC]